LLNALFLFPISVIRVNQWYGFPLIGTPIVARGVMKMFLTCVNCVCS